MNADTSSTLFRVHIERPEGDRLVATVPAEKPDEIRNFIRRQYPGARILKIKFDRSGGIR